MFEEKFFSIFESSFSEYTQDILRKLYLGYFAELENVVTNFSHFSYLSDSEYRDIVKKEYFKTTEFFTDDNNLNFDRIDLEIVQKAIQKLYKKDLAFQIKLNNLNLKNQLAIEFCSLITSLLKTEHKEDEWQQGVNNQDIIIGETSFHKNYLFSNPKIVDLLLATIPGKVYHLGITKHLDINKAKVDLHYLLEKITNIEDLLDKLEVSDVYWHNDLYSRLTFQRINIEGNRVISLERVLAVMQIVTNFKKQIVSFVETYESTENKVLLINRSRDIKIRQELIRFEKRFNDSFSIPIGDLEYAKILEYKEKFKSLLELDDIQFLNRLGFEISTEFMKQINNNRKLSDAVDGLKYYTLVKTKDIKEFLKKPEGASRIKIVAEAITDFKNEVTPVQVLSADNKPMYAIIERNFISKKLQELQERFEDSTINEQKQIKDATIVYNLGVTTTNEAQKANKLSEKPSYIMHINNMLHNISPFIATGDKSSYFGFRNLVKMYDATVITEEIHEEYKSLYKNILEQEFNTFLKYKSADEDIVLPKIAKHFGVSSEFSKGLEEKLFVDGKLTYLEFNSFYSTIEEGFNNAVIEYTEKKIKTLVEKLIDNGIVLSDGNFAGIDSNMANNKNLTSGYDLAHKLHLFILESNYIQSKYLVGDLGYYGMNLNKRVPTAMATKKDGDYTEGLADLLSTDPELSRGHEFKFNKKIGKDLVFSALIHDDLFFKDEEFNELIKSSLIEDFGFALIHIEAFRFQQIARGDWTIKDENIYQADLEYKLDFEKQFSFIKKGFYFGDQIVRLSFNSNNILNTPLFLKMAIFPLTNAMTKRFGCLKEVKNFMEEFQISMLLDDSACKIGRKPGYKLFGENGEINNNVIQFKQMLYWKYL